MYEGKLSEFYDFDWAHSHTKTNILKLALVPFMFFVILGFTDKVGGYISTYSNFVGEVFFILFGFYALVPDKELRVKKLKRSLRRALKFLVVMFFGFIALNVVYLYHMHSLSYLLSEAIWRKRTIFSFLVLNVWPLPVGNSFWIVQSLVYAYLFFLLAEKKKLSRFYLPILIILGVFALATGEFAAFLGFPHFGYSYIPGGAFTRAIPYMLIGMYMRKHVDKLARVHRFLYLLLFPVGLAAAVGEIELLNHIGKLAYAGHTPGFGLMAFSLCCFVIVKPAKRNNYFSRRGGNFSLRMYAFCQPVSFVVWLLLYRINPVYAATEKSFDIAISLAVCAIIVLVWDLLSYFIYSNRKFKKKKDPEIPDGQAGSEEGLLKRKIQKVSGKFKK